MSWGTEEQRAERAEARRHQGKALAVRAEQTSLLPGSGVGAAHVFSLPRVNQLPTWNPGKWTDDVQGTGEFVTARQQVAPDQDPDLTEPPPDAEILEKMGLSPEVWQVTSHRQSKWQVWGGDWLEAWRVTVRRRLLASRQLTPDNVAELLKGSKPCRHKRPAKGTLMIPVGDLQVGKRDGGGTKETVARFRRVTEKVAGYADEHGPVKNLILPWLGDCVEGYISQHGTLVTNEDESLTNQLAIFQDLMYYQVKMLAPLAEHVLIPVVPGNHDETTRQFKVPVNDSFAIHEARSVARGLRENGAGKFAHVAWAMPDRNSRHSVVRRVVTQEGALVLAFTHGHVFRPRRPEGALAWWGHQAHGRTAVGYADMLVSAHFHHYQMKHTGGGKTWLQIPAMDGGSEWYEEITGENTPSGVVSLWLTPDAEGGWTDLKIWN